MRFSLFLLLWLPLQSAMAWTGIAAILGQSQEDWLFADGAQSAQHDFYGLSVEDRTRNGIRIGARAGQFDVRLSAHNGAAAERFHGKSLGVYLRWPLALSSTIQLEPRVRYQYQLGQQALASRQQISWSEIRLQLAFRVQLGALSLRPFVAWRHIDGDISTALASRLFVQQQSGSYGLALDLYVEPGAYIRLQTRLGDQQAASIGFVRTY